MRKNDEQEARRRQFVWRLLGGEYGYPPGGWTEIHGETGKSALIWSLVRWRTEKTARPTLILPVVETYDYAHTAKWSGIDERLIVVASRPKALLKFALMMVRSGQVGQVVAEGLGFLLGAGKLTPAGKALLGDASFVTELAYEAETRDVACYATSYSVSAGRDYLAEYSLGGRLMLEVAHERRIFLERSGYHLAAARTVGEYFVAENLLDVKRKRGRFEIVYAGGPVRLRTPEKEAYEDPEEKGD